MHCICGCVRKRDSKRTNKNGAWHAHWASNLNLKLLYCCASRLFHLRYQRRRRRRRRQQQRWQTGKFKIQRERELERRLLESNVTWRESESEWALASSRYVCMYVSISERKQNWTRVRASKKLSHTHAQLLRGRLKAGATLTSQSTSANCLLFCCTTATPAACDFLFLICTHTQTHTYACIICMSVCIGATHCCCIFTGIRWWRAPVCTAAAVATTGCCCDRRCCCCFAGVLTGLLLSVSSALPARSAISLSHTLSVCCHNWQVRLQCVCVCVCEPAIWVR